MKPKNKTFDLIEQSDAYLQKALETQDFDKKMDYIDKALDVNPENVDAYIALSEIAESPFDGLQFLEVAIIKAEQNLKSQGLFEKPYIGDFWGIFETRTYMTARHYKIRRLFEVGYYHQAVFECKDLLVLSKNDNLGIRYSLMALYAVLKDDKSAKKLYRKYNENLFMFMFPYAMALYLSNQLDEAKTVFDLIKQNYPFAYNIIANKRKPEPRDIQDMEFGIPVGRPGEVYLTLEELGHLVTPDFLKWYREISKKRPLTQLN